MKRIVLFIFLLLLALLVVAFFVSKSFDFDTIEGRGADKKVNVKWAFKNANNFEELEDYLLLQRVDKVRQEPRLSVQGKYWLEGGRYLELNNITQDTFSGKECLGFRLEDYVLKCSIDNTEPALVCHSSFLAKEKILPAKANVNDVTKAYIQIKSFYENYPTRSSEGIKYSGAEIPQPLQKYRQTFPETQINCWVERSGISTEKPASFLCDKNYHKCESSQSIELQYEK